MAIVIDTTTPVSIPNYTQRSSRDMGMLAFDPSRVVLKPSEMHNSTVRDVVDEFGGNGLPAHVGWWLYCHRDEEGVREFLEGWKGYLVCFVCTELRGSAGISSVFFLGFNGEEWCWDCDYYHYYFAADRRVATLASS